METVTVRVKPKIRKRDDAWVVTRPPFGFRPTPDETSHPSFRDAVTDMTDKAEHYTTPSSAERSTQHADQVGSVPPWTPLEYRAR